MHAIIFQSFERLMTFYTPDISSGPPGSFPSVQIVPHEHVPGELMSNTSSVHIHQYLADSL